MGEYIKVVARFLDGQGLIRAEKSLVNVAAGVEPWLGRDTVLQFTLPVGTGLKVMTTGLVTEYFVLDEAGNKILLHGCIGLLVYPTAMRQPWPSQGG